MSAADRFGACFGEAEMFHFASLDEFFHGAGYVFDRHFAINAVLVEQVNYVSLEALERGIGNLLDALRLAV